jgi:two-component sensor histidine kinase
VKHGAGRVAVSCRSKDGEIAVSDEDDGPGLAPGFTIARGKGVGLYTIERIVEHMGGSFVFKNAERGTRFTILFKTGSTRLQ